MWSNCVVKLFGRVGISLTVVEYFSKRVINDLIKSEVSTGVGIFHWRYCHLVRKVNIERALSRTYQAYAPKIIGILLWIKFCNNKLRTNKIYVNR